MTCVEDQVEVVVPNNGEWLITMSEVTQEMRDTPCYNRLKHIKEPWKKGYHWCGDICLWARFPAPGEVLPF